MSTWLQDHIQRNRLLYSLMLFILSISVALAVLLAIVKFYLGYKKEVKKIDEVMLLIHESYMEQISASLWSFDYNQMKVQAQGILNLPNIKKVVVTEQFEGQENPIVSLGEITDKSYVKQTFPIEYNSHGMMKNIGVLSVYAGLDQIRNEIKHQIGSGFFMMLAEILTLSLCIVFIFNAMVANHLGKIQRFLRDSDRETFGRTLILDRRHAAKPDVLDSIVGYINGIIDQNISNESRLNLMEKEMTEDRANLSQCKERLNLLEKIRNDEADVWALLRDNQTVTSLSHHLVSYLCRYFGAGTGLFYHVDEDTGKIRAMAGYAVTLDKDRVVEFEIGKGVLGQAVLNKKPCCLACREDSSFMIQSSLGHAEPGHILIYPFEKKDRVFCVLEMGHFKPFDADSLVLLDEIREQVAYAMETAELRERKRGA